MCCPHNCAISPHFPPLSLHSWSQAFFGDSCCFRFLSQITIETCFHTPHSSHLALALCYAWNLCGAVEHYSCLYFLYELSFFFLIIASPPHTQTHTHMQRKAPNTQFVGFLISPSMINKYKTKRPPTEQVREVQREREWQSVHSICMCV